MTSHLENHWLPILEIHKDAVRLGVRGSRYLPLCHTTDDLAAANGGCVNYRLLICCMGEIAWWHVYPLPSETISLWLFAAY